MTKKSVSVERDMKAETVVMGDQTNITNRAERDVVSGDVTNTTNITLVLQMAAYTPPPDLVQLRADYLAHLRRTYRALDFKGIPQLHRLPSELLLDDVYVPLLARPELPEGETWSRRLAGRAFAGEALPDETAAVGHLESAAPTTVDEALAKHAQVVVLGDPGSGKSTLLKHLALRLAAEAEAPLPILVPLNAYARAAGGHSLQTYLPEYFRARAQTVAALGPLFDSAIAQGRAVILLDGLDEVQSGRPHLVEKVEAFARDVAAQGCKVVVTSRIVGYRDAPLNTKDWSLFTLLDFDHEQIEAFTDKWCPAFERSTLGDTPEARAAAEQERAGLLDAIHANPGVAQLASNPLLLTILALIKRQGVELPRTRVKLYDRYLETLIEAWDKARSLDKGAVGESLDFTQTLNVLGPLALHIRETNPEAGLIPERALLNWLTAYYMGDEWGLKRGPALEKAQAFFNSVRQHSNLLLERGEGQFGFIHLTFEEALAAYGLAARGQLRLSASLTLIEQHAFDPGWRETILLAVGVWGLLHGQQRVAGEVVRAILKLPNVGEDVGKNVLLAGACLEDVGADGLGRVVAQEVLDALWATSRNRALPPAVQRDAGFSLGRAGWRPADLNQLIPIEAGPFLTGDDGKQPAKIEASFVIAKYPITNVQYAEFVKAKGYDQREWWGDDGWAWRTGAWDTKAKEDYEKRALERRPPEERHEPFWWHDTKWNNPLAPVVGVSWFEAEAYCHWLTQKVGQPVRLPTEQEWERAARHTDGREYPWGNTFDRKRLNGAEFWGEQDDLDWSKWLEAKGYESASTTIVGQFADGNSQEGLSDTSGNVWEWTDSWLDAEKIYRVVRGGSWNLSRRSARCAYRNWDVPVFFYFNFGFRLCSPAHISAF